MKYLLAQPADLRFQWELDVALTNIRSLDSDTPIVVLFLLGSQAVVEHIQSRYSGLEVHAYKDERMYNNYLATVRPYLMYRYLKEDGMREQEDYFQIDSDIIFRELPDFSKMPLEGRVCWASDCSGYIDYEYLITRQKGERIVGKFSEILNIPVETIRKTPGGGAQWLMSKPTANLWWHIWQDSQLLYDYLDPINSNIQKWTAEMWAQLYNLVKYGWEVKIHPELDFCRPTDDIKMWDAVKILHNAGVMGEDASSLFFKGKYLQDTPFEDDLSWVRRDKASRKYADAVKKVYNCTTKSNT